jgi:hypothetical protein
VETTPDQEKLSQYMIDMIERIKEEEPARRAAEEERLKALPRPKSLRDIEDEHQIHRNFRFEDLVSFVKSTWEGTGQICPRGFKYYKENYVDYQDMNDGELMQANRDKFKGINNTDEMNLPFTDALSLPHVTYDHTNQGRDPLQSLMHACFAYGANFKAAEMRVKLEKFRKDNNRDLEFDMESLELELEAGNIEAAKSTLKHMKEFRPIKDFQLPHG